MAHLQTTGCTPGTRRNVLDVTWRHSGPSGVRSTGGLDRSKSFLGGVSDISGTGSQCASKVGAGSPNTLPPLRDQPEDRLPSGSAGLRPKGWRGSPIGPAALTAARM